MRREHGHTSGFRGDVKAVRHRVEGEHVGILADRLALDDLEAAEIHDQQACRAFVRHEQSPARGIHGEPVRM
jgi:hypothetical protein